LGQAAIELAAELIARLATDDRVAPVRDSDTLAPDAVAAEDADKVEGASTP
jgi:hypothetical protein